MKYALMLFVALAAVATAAGSAAVAGKDSLHASLSGKAETPRGDANGRGPAEVKIAGRRVCWELNVSGVGKPTAAHVHKGRPGKAGPVVIPLGATYEAKGCTTTSATIARALQLNPSAYYVNVHNAKYPAGALRGQLHGDGTSGSSGTPTKLTGTVGPGFTISLTQGGKNVTTLKAGRYTFVIDDKASIHSYGLDGPNGFAKDFTSVPFTGTKTFTLTLRAGKYKYYCQPHESSMFGNFTVT